VTADEWRALAQEFEKTSGIPMHFMWWELWHLASHLTQALCTTTIRGFFSIPLLALVARPSCFDHGGLKLDSRD